MKPELPPYRPKVENKADAFRNHASEKNDSEVKYSPPSFSFEELHACDKSFGRSKNLQVQHSIHIKEELQISVEGDKDLETQHDINTLPPKLPVERLQASNANGEVFPKIEPAINHELISVKLESEVCRNVFAFTSELETQHDIKTLPPKLPVEKLQASNANGEVFPKIEPAINQELISVKLEREVCRNVFAFASELETQHIKPLPPKLPVEKLQASNANGEVFPKIEPAINHELVSDKSESEACRNVFECKSEQETPSCICTHTRSSNGSRETVKKKSYLDNCLMCIPNKVHVCEVCNDDFPTQRVLKRHKLSHVVCEACNKGFASKEDYKRHFINYHICTICQKFISTINELQMHLLLHQFRNPQFCYLCHASFNTMADFQNHSRLHSPEKSDFQNYYLIHSGISRGVLLNNPSPLGISNQHHSEDSQTIQSTPLGR